MTPTYGYKKIGEEIHAELFQLNDGEGLPAGYYDSPDAARAAGESDERAHKPRKSKSDD